MATEERRIVFDVAAGVPDPGGESCTYEACGLYDTWSEASADILAALEAGRHVIVERHAWTAEEYAKNVDDDLPPGYNPLLGERTTAGGNEP